MATIYLDGKYVDRENAKISVYDHGFLYGDGVFEGIRVYNYKVFKLKEHIDRLYDSARAIALNIPVDKNKMISIVEETVKKEGSADSYIRLIVTRGIGSLGISPESTKNPSIICIVDGIKIYPKELYEKGMKVIISSVIRNSSFSLSPRIKSLNYLNNILAKLEAIHAGANEAIMLNQKGEIAECTSDNVFIVKGGIIKTPLLSAGSLAGITRDTVIELARANGYTVVEENLTTYDLYTADEAFLTGSAAEIVPIVKIDIRDVADGKPGVVFKDLKEKYSRFVRDN